MTQAAFSKALLSPDLPPPEGLTDAHGRPAGRRFSVYRNNVAGSLTEVLEQGFPVLRKLLGAEYFTALAGIFLRQHPPRNRIMMLYGTKMPAFLEGFSPLKHLPYLADIARLEQALRESYHAADAPAVPTARLAQVSPETFVNARLQLAPALRRIASAYPILSIWRANTEDAAPTPIMRAETVLILRPQYDPHPHLLDRPADAFILALMGGKTVGEAMDAAGDGFDLNACLSLLLANGAVIALDEETP